MAKKSSSSSTGESSSSSTGEYEVGFAKPPKHSQFKKGRSGNPKGRPKRPKDIASMVAEVCNAPVRVTTNGKVRYTTKMNVALMRQMNKALDGDARATRLMLDLLEKNTDSGNGNGHLEDLLYALMDPDNRREGF